jgi:hypothetical protein
MISRNGIFPMLFAALYFRYAGILVDISIISRDNNDDMPSMLKMFKYLSLVGIK